MSRLDSFIRRLEAQRACLGLAAILVAATPGPVLELGLGNGRTYDHLRSLFPGRDIFAFDRALAAHPDCVPDADRLFLGDMRETLQRLALPARAALVHVDIGGGSEAASRAMAQQLAPLVARHLAPGGVVVADQPMAEPGWTAQSPPDGVAVGRYFVYRARV
ncbi:MAG: class I SAM-dependent methyltransferase [Alphaproteobacteria bacterium]